ncbi:glyceraldehyde 3-phosphate dehydrogenase N-terminal domain-containing protein [Kribbella sp. NBC_00662]|uniref:glyceraldehyde 3-phosphate dehydrogenase NAD-binding domain-containing protein n=1 Tax=Kribbella sp. NBC_00662 TaxID=2975969 RepID=UPI0032500C46
MGSTGFGRIGRDYLRCVLERRSSGIEVVAINDVAARATLAHPLRCDSTYGPLKEEVGQRVGLREPPGRPGRARRRLPGKEQR